MDYMKIIDRYGEEITDINVSPFETIELLHLRTNLERHFSNMNIDEQLKLLYFDLKVIKNAKQVSEHIGEIYNFDESEEPESQWWWHLNKVANGKIILKSHPLYTNIAL